MVNAKGQTVYSYSQLNTFEQCPYSWFKIYKEKAPRENNAFSSYGTLIHELLQQCACGDLKREDLAELFEWSYEASIPEEFPPNKYVNLHDSYLQQGIDFFHNFEGFDDLEILGVEDHFEIDMGDFALQGFIDLIYRDKNGKLVCRDWKSGKRWTKKDIAEHGKQPYLYSAYIKEKFGRYPDRLEFFHFREGNKKSVIPFNIKDFHAAEQWARDTVKAINETWDYASHYDEFFCKELCSCRSSCDQKKKG